MFRTRTSNAGVEALAAPEESGGGQAGLHRGGRQRPGVPARLCPQLRELSLDSTSVTDNGAPALKSMAGLKSLNLYHTLVTEKGMQELKAALPSCEIVFDRDSALPNRRSK